MNNRMWKKHMEDVFGILSRLALAGILSAALVLPASAGDSEQARRIYDRLAGVPPTAQEVIDIESAMAGTNTDCGDGTYPILGSRDVDGNVDTAAECAAFLAMENKNFYNVTLKNFAAP